MKKENEIEKNGVKVVHNFRSFTTNDMIRKSASKENIRKEELKRHFQKQVNKIFRDNTEQI